MHRAVCSTSTLARGKRSSSRPGCFTLRSFWKGGWVSPRACLDVEKSKNPWPTGLELRSLHRPVRSQSLYRLLQGSYETYTMYYEQNTESFWMLEHEGLLLGIPGRTTRNIVDFLIGLSRPTCSSQSVIRVCGNECAPCCYLSHCFPQYIRAPRQAAVLSLCDNFQPRFKGAR
jgi:hypothetical protein